ncbi:Sigma-70, region 4 [Thiohalospira halophila DSM 15071]|uniref:Sigma-70, region 4 n=1 Tax=Thiohalospira halophila DSM 15071 TaxID=1123397 RepID=A0A1I1VW72_9GAMM|nr:Sigma-70, region 4 [Thiohalospira halophila DSM 15071]
MSGSSRDEIPRGGATLEQVGAELGVTRERARQIEAQALAKLRRNLEARGLGLDDLLPERIGGPGSSLEADDL